jgi:hypothetical protein
MFELLPLHLLLFVSSLNLYLQLRAKDDARALHDCSHMLTDFSCTFFSDDDDFFDRTKKKSSNQQSNGQQSVETADSLLEKKNTITNDIEGKKKLLEEEKNKLAQRHDADLGDDLDAYMSGLSSQLGITL